MLAQTRASEMFLVFSYLDAECDEGKRRQWKKKDRRMRLGQYQKEGLWFVRLSTTGLLSDGYGEYPVGCPTQYARCAASLCKWEQGR